MKNHDMFAGAESPPCRTGRASPRPPPATDDAHVACEDNLAYMARLDDASMKLIVTSPPYNVGKSYEKRTPLAQYVDDQRRVISECLGCCIRPARSAGR